MPTSFKFVDEAGAIAFIENLEANLATEKAATSAANASLLAMTGERDKVKGERDTAQGSLTAVTTDRDSLKTANGTLTAENTRLTGEMSDFNKRVATELAKHGIRKDAVQTGVQKKDGEKLTATEEILNAKGVSSLAELEAKRK